MNIVKDQVTELISKLTITIGESDYQESVSNTLKDYRKKANIKGFRPGKVPMGMINKLYGKPVLADEVNKKLSEAVSKYISDEKLELLGEPLPSETDQKPVDFDNDKEFEFVLEIAEAPNLELNINKKTKLPLYQVKVDDKLINEQVDGLKNQLGEQVPAEIATKDSFVRCDTAEVNEQNEKVEDGFALGNISFSVTHLSEEVKTLFEGKKVDDTVIFNPFTAFENKQELITAFASTEEKVEELNKTLEFKIEEILEFKEAELNEETLLKAFPNDGLKTEDDLREKLIADFKKILDVEAEYRLLVDAREKFTDKIKDIALPEDFLLKFIKYGDQEGKITDEVLEKEFPIYLKDLRWQLIKKKIIKENDIKVEQDEIKFEAIEQVKSQLRQYGLPESYMTEENLAQYANTQMQNQEELNKFYDLAISRKLIGFFKENTKLDEKEISLDEFKELK